MEFDANFWSVTLDFAGKVLLAVIALMVHHKVEKERKIDIHVVREMKLEMFFGILSIALFIASYVFAV